MASAPARSAAHGLPVSVPLLPLCSRPLRPRGLLSFLCSYLRGVNNAAELRAGILAHLRQSRDSGLGDPDDEQGPLPSGEPTSPASPRLLEAASELLREVRLLRQE